MNVPAHHVLMALHVVMESALTPVAVYLAIQELNVKQVREMHIYSNKI